MTRPYDHGEALAKQVEARFRLFLGDELFEWLGEETERRGYVNECDPKNNQGTEVTRP